MLRELTRLAIVDSVLRVDAVFVVEYRPRTDDDRQVAGWWSSERPHVGIVADISDEVGDAAETLGGTAVDVTDAVVTGLVFLLTTGSDAGLDSVVPFTPLRSRYDSWPLGDATRLNLSDNGACDGTVDR